MTLDETIKRTEELAELNEDQARVYKEQGDTMGYLSYEECAKEHRRLAEWLKELKAYKDARPTSRWSRQTDTYHDYYECENCGIGVGLDDIKNFCPNCGSKMIED